MATAPKQPVVPLYAVTIHKCMSQGELNKMKQLSADAEKHLAEVSDALAQLNAEIAKVEGQPGA